MMNEKQGTSGADPSLEVLEHWLGEESEFEAFARTFYEEHGRAFLPGEVPDVFNRSYVFFPSDLNNAFSHRRATLRFGYSGRGGKKMCTRTDYSLLFCANKGMIRSCFVKIYADRIRIG